MLACKGHWAGGRGPYQCVKSDRVPSLCSPLPSVLPHSLLLRDPHSTPHGVSSPLARGWPSPIPPPAMGCSWEQAKPVRCWTSVRSGDSGQWPQSWPHSGHAALPPQPEGRAGVTKGNPFMSYPQPRHPWNPVLPGAWEAPFPEAPRGRTPLHGHQQYSPGDAWKHPTLHQQLAVNKRRYIPQENTPRQCTRPTSTQTRCVHLRTAM